MTVERDGRTFPVAVTLAKFEVRGKNIVTTPDPGWRGARVDFPSAHKELDPQFYMGLQTRRSRGAGGRSRARLPGLASRPPPRHADHHVQNTSVESRKSSTNKPPRIPTP